ncbi:amidase [Planococcus salinus]|uniref:Amidase n=1 Tax=Planococcus salinus TaxID=1848460 RepID=A0A3M8P6X2_9BACL|nr:amidase [Planococcus salinus]RNF39020.1 amidase [Planococcus salinus]
MEKAVTLALTISETGKMLRQKKISPTELTALFLKQIETAEPLVKAWTVVQADAVLKRAKMLEETNYKESAYPPLFAIPYGAKDIIHTKKLATEAGSKTLKGFVPEHDATVVRLLEQAGAILLGKTTTTEFASLESPPETRNPWHLAHTPGGSSTGSAAAVAGGMALFALGTQTSGSLSRPAAYNGLTVLKASYGRISKAGIIPASWSLDHVGAITKTVEDTVIVYNQLAGYDREDETTWSLPKQPLALREEKGYKLGVIGDAYFEADPETMTVFQEAIKALESLGFSVKTVFMPPGFEKSIEAQLTVLKAETASYQYDNFQKNGHLLGEFLQQRIKEGLQIQAHDYLQAQQTRKVFRQELHGLFDDVDVLLSPATPSAAPEGIGKTGSPAFITPFTNAGVPTLTLPMGYTKKKNLPLGMQLISRHYEEQKLIDVGYAYQRATDWHMKNPEFVQ